MATVNDMIDVLSSRDFEIENYELFKTIINRFIKYSEIIGDEYNENNIHQYLEDFLLSMKILVMTVVKAIESEIGDCYDSACEFCDNKKVISIIADYALATFNEFE